MPLLSYRIQRVALRGLSRWLDYPIVNVMGIKVLYDHTDRGLDEAIVSILVGGCYTCGFTHLQSSTDVGLVIDIGAHQGIFSIYAAKILHACRVVAIEPEPRNYHKLLANVALNDVGERLLPLNAAIADVDGYACLYVSKQSNWHTLMPDRCQSSEIMSVRKVPACRLDTLLELLQIDNVDFLKFDFEGAECKLVESCEKLLKEGRIKRIGGEVHSKILVSEVARKLRHYNYSVVFFNLNGANTYLLYGEIS